MPGTVAKRTPGVQEEPDRPADDQARQGVANVNRFRLNQLDIKVQPEECTDSAGQGQVVGLAQAGPALGRGRAGKSVRLGSGRRRGGLGHDSTRRARPPSAIIRAMWPNVWTSSPLRAKIDACSLLARRPQVVAVGVAGADRHDLDPLPPRRQGLLDGALGGVGKAVGQDHDVAFPVGGDELAAGHLQRVGEVRASPRPRAGQSRRAAAVTLLVAAHWRATRLENEIRPTSMVVKSQRSRNSRGRRLGLDQRLADHARRDVDQQEDADPLGFANDGDLGRSAQPREIVGHGLDRQGQAVPRVALDGLHLDHAVDVVRDARRRPSPRRRWREFP